MSDPGTTLAGRTVLITGGNSGIGLATARACLQRRAKVALFARDEGKLRRALADLDGQGIGLAGDVTTREDLERVMELVRGEYGRLDALFVNAGVAEPRPAEEVDEGHFDHHFSVNVKGAFFTMQAALPLLADGASVVLNTSALGVLGMPGMSVYSATKAALRSFARTLSAEWAERGIRVNAVAPGPIETPIYGRMGLPEDAVQQMGQQIREQVPAGRFGRPEEVAELVAWLASPASEYVRGVEFTIDGGMSQL